MAFPVGPNDQETEPMEALSREQYNDLLDTLDVAERGGADHWLPEVYTSLRAIAGQYIRNMGPRSTLQPTALVNEAYIRLADKQTAYWKGRTHFTAVAARAMRFVLVNHLRDRHALKRGGDARRLTVSGSLLGDDALAFEVIALNDLLETLMTRSERQARIVELRIFGGMTIEETAEAVGVSPSTVKADWTIACAWLKAQM